MLRMRRATFTVSTDGSGNAPPTTAPHTTDAASQKGNIND